MPKVPEIDHATYKRIKHYDRAQLTQFCTNMYAQGYSEGSADGIDAERVFEVISGVRGIGPKRIAAIREAVNAAFGEGSHAGT